MRILHVTGTLDPAAGGPPSVAVRLACAQAGLGADVTLFSYSDLQKKQQIDPAYLRVPNIDRVQFQTAQMDSRWESWTARNGRQMLNTLLRDIDIVHLHGVWERLLLMTAAQASKKQIPYVVTPHGMLDPWSLAQSAWKKRLALALGYRRMLDQAAFLHVLNSDENRLIEPMGLRSPRKTIPNGVFLEEIEPLPASGAFRQRLGLKDEPIILFLGRLHFKKGLDILALAFRDVARARADAHLVVAGPDGGEKDNFEHAIRTLGLADNTHLVGPLYGEEKMACLVDADCFCLPSRQEGFSIAILESLSCGVPVVISSECHFPEVEEAGAGRVTELDAAKTAEAILNILESADLRRRMSENATRLVRERYTWPQIARMSIAAYEERLGGTPVSAHPATSHPSL